MSTQIRDYDTRDYDAERLPLLQKVATVSDGLERAIFNPHNGGHVYFPDWDVKLSLNAGYCELDMRDAAAMAMLLHRLFLDSESAQFQFIEGARAWSFCTTTEDPCEIVTFGSGPSHAYAVADAYANYFSLPASSPQTKGDTQ